MPLSNSTKVSAGQRRCCSSSLVTSWPGFSRRISNTARGWSWSLMRTPCLRSSPAEGSNSKTPNRKGSAFAGRCSAMNSRQVPILGGVYHHHFAETTALIIPHEDKNRLCFIWKLEAPPKTECSSPHLVNENIIDILTKRREVLCNELTAKVGVRAGLTEPKGDPGPSLRL